MSNGAERGQSRVFPLSPNTSLAEVAFDDENL